MPHARHALRLPLAVALLLILAPLAVGCGSAKREDPILRLSAAEALAEGKELMERGKYAQARKLLTHAFEVEPNSESGREALLLVADSLFLQGGSQNLIQAEAKYRDFLNRFPTSDRAPYVQYQIGRTLQQRVERPDRDQSMTEQALTAYNELLRLYPDSEYAEEARAQIGELRQHLAQHEYLVARFYVRYGLPMAAVARLEQLLADYPDYPDKAKVYYHLGVAEAARGQAEEARKWFDRLRQEYPGSEYVAEIPTLREQGKG
ncbi:MAG TPA: outer membrane protein assembly factor BamD [Thermoanaerobaculia bacterium]|nr:outer membrane protein assembly factor BamD [Thermoanaerobaculia bacterium]